jgi:hypothetical protein
MKGKPILLLLIVLGACSAARDAEPIKNKETLEPPTDAAVEESAGSVIAESTLYPLFPITGNPPLPLDPTGFLRPLWIDAREGDLLFFDDIVYDYSLSEHRYVGIYKTETPVNKHFNSSGSYYFYDNTLVKYDRDAIAPNTHITIYRGEGCCLSIYRSNAPQRYTVIKSKDLLTWELTEIEHLGPILLFEKGSKVYALVGSEILDVSNPDGIRMVEKLSQPALLPDRGVSYAHSPYDSIGVCLVMDNFLFTRVYRTIEYGHEEYFLLFNTDDYSFELFRMDIAEIKDVLAYILKAVKRGDGWKYYWFGKKDSYVIDPFLPGGPKIIETLPPVEAIWGQVWS